MSRKPLTNQLRDKLKAKLGACPTCGHQRWDSLRGLAAKVGTSPATLSRWLNGGKLPDADTLNKAWAYFARGVRKAKP